jgi:hypothetical protein
VEHQAACSRIPLCLIPHMLDEELTVEEVDPQIPVRLDP